MNINFNFHGSPYTADLHKNEDNIILVQFNGCELEKRFGSTLPFHIENKSVAFDTLNLSHSDLYELNSTISRAITEQCSEIF